ncbi:isocitrate lyase/phosphoenolpyruvate mutase family protein [Marinibaculum pumilum]|uniref:Isocitrate lyase/phosphoenolpyruvate mutase family protein n=1 Tax=Marinibaculum pumilum TaxID=1766165 RepID=A0ABV7L363_9PROT
MSDADLFRQLHQGPEVLVLPNAWDAGTARLFADAGARAIATTSSGIAWSLGCRDGDRVPLDLYLQVLRNIRRVVDLPVSADIEGGYADDPALVRDKVARFLDAGVVGINLEDGTADPDLACAKIEAARQAATAAGIALFINARTDIWLRGLAAGREVEEALDRARRYRSAGCDGLFVPGRTDAAGIAAVAGGTELPVNVMARPGLPPLATLAELGVRRLSAGGAIVQAAWGHARHLAAAMLRGDSEHLFDGALAYPATNALFPVQGAES